MEPKIMPLPFKLPSFKDNVTEGSIVVIQQGKKLYYEKVVATTPESIITDEFEYFRDDFRRPEDSPNERIWVGLGWHGGYPQVA